MAKKRRLKVVPPKVSTYPWVIVRVNDASLGVRFSCVDGARTRKGAEDRAVKEVSEKGGVYAVLQYRNVFAPQVVGKATVAAKGIVAPPPIKPAPDILFAGAGNGVGNDEDDDYGEDN